MAVVPPGTHSGSLREELENRLQHLPAQCVLSDEQFVSSAQYLDGPTAGAPASTQNLWQAAAELGCTAVVNDAVFASRVDRSRVAPSIAEARPFAVQSTRIATFVRVRHMRYEM